MTERDIEKKLNTWAKSHGGKAFKWVSPGNAGVPDRILILPNIRPIFVELKTDKGVLTNLQRMQQRKLTELGQEVWTIYGAEGLKKFCLGLEMLYEL